MKLQMKAERWQCAVTAFAMALDIPVEELIDRLGHDGGEIVFPDLPFPADRRSHNIHEMIHVALDLGYAVTPIPLRPAILANDLVQHVEVGTEEENWQRFVHQIHVSRGVIECQGPRSYHLLAYEKGRIFDPEGIEFPYSREFCEQRGSYTYCLWRMDRIRKHDIGT